ncbi:hypothetical protein WISP_56483 [Willisornis vidua]|uniref:Chemokine interleukin-8-like domain-containing protein n=1 Tax=Willisornis vidua TaxID=1566151 RepID=A0ABQ9DH62_9PASS|nr:hypothetical protein WISP_56483 [Willisornis vidua]
MKHQVPKEEVPGQQAEPEGFCDFPNIQQELKQVAQWDQPELPTTRRGVSTQHCQGPGGSTPRVSNGVWEAEVGMDRDTQGAANRTQHRHPAALAKHLNTVFHPNSLVTVKNRIVCANPEESWVQTYLKDFEALES